MHRRVQSVTGEDSSDVVNYAGRRGAWKGWANTVDLGFQVQGHTDLYLTTLKNTVPMVPGEADEGLALRFEMGMSHRWLPFMTAEVH